ncbi:MAG: PEGA domain-containing protein [Polyangiaceae bacterium]|nr:PEGA domain-containing protein [Polyangiaceae bacterium]
MLRRFEALPVLLASCFYALTSFAGAPNPEAEAAIRDGKNSYNSGDYEAAIEAFKRAYAVEPDSETLYQLGKAYAMADWPVEAVDAFERYLDAAPPNLSAERRSELAGAIEGQKRRVGTIVLQVTPEQASVTLDDTLLDRTAVAGPLAVRQGFHVIAASLDGYVPQARSVQVRGTRSELIRLILVPEKPPVHEGLLGIQCQVPAVSVLVDERQLATTPLEEPIMLPEGVHRLRLERSGYRPQTTTISVSRARTTRVECDLPIVQPLAASGRLELDFPETGTVLLVDGAPAAKSSVLPPGLHWVEIRHYGFLPWSSALRVDAGQVHRVNVVLTPTPSYVQDIEQRAQRRRTWSYVLGATGIAVAGTALGIGLWNDGRYSDWEHARTELDKDYRASGPSAPTAAELEPRRDDVNDQLRSIHAVDIATAVLGVAGGMLLGSGAWLFFTTEAPPHPLRESAAVRRVRQGVGVNLDW